MYKDRESVTRVVRGLDASFRCIVSIYRRRRNQAAVRKTSGTVALCPMSFGPTALRGFTAAGTGGPVEYKLARNAVVKDFHKGRLSRLDVCDAHPELIRAARNVGMPLDEICPICEDETLVNVTYVFGPRLPPNGRCPASVTELDKLCRRQGEVACYVVEVCPECRWNHLTRSYPAGAAVRARSRALKS
jgi:hypothetical protein